MNTTEQAEFLSSIIEELEADPATTSEDRQLLQSASEFIKPLLKSEPEKLYAGYNAGYYYIRFNLETKMGMIAKLKALGYTLHFLQPPFGKPVMLKKRDD